MLARCNGLHTQTFRVERGTETQRIRIEAEIDCCEEKNSKCCIRKGLDCCTTLADIGNENLSLPFVNLYDFEMFKMIIKATTKVPGLYCIANYGR
jgi:hypothetical protein